MKTKKFNFFYYRFVNFWRVQFSQAADFASESILYHDKIRNFSLTSTARDFSEKFHFNPSSISGSKKRVATKLSNTKIMPHALFRSFAFDLTRFVRDIFANATSHFPRHLVVSFFLAQQRGSQRNVLERINESHEHVSDSLTGNTLKLAVAARDKGTAENSLPFSREAHLSQYKRREHIKT